MLKKIRTQFYQLISSLGYNITDNGEYKENFPWIMVRTNDNMVLPAINSITSSISLIIDIFSTYSGEKEIIDIVENINNHLNDLYSNPELTYVFQKSLKILDDKSTGPVRKHGIVVYEFMTGYGMKEEQKNDGEN